MGKWLKLTKLSGIIVIQREEQILDFTETVFDGLPCTVVTYLTRLSGLPGSEIFKETPEQIYSMLQSQEVLADIEARITNIERFFDMKKQLTKSESEGK